MKIIYKILILIVLLLLIYVFQDWLKTFVITSLGGFTKKETIIKTKVEYTKGNWEIDSTAVFKKYIETKGIILNPKPKIIYQIKYDTIRDTLYSNKLKHFEVKFKDSLIDGKMTIKNFFNGNLYSTSFKYKPKFSKYLKRVDTIKTYKVVKKYLSKERAKFGLGVGYDWSRKNMQFLGSYTFKNNWQIIFEYEQIFSPQLINGISKTNNQSIKIINNF
jgi:hypothetical protein